MGEKRGKNEDARVCTTPWRDSDGYSWGSKTVLIIGSAAIPMGAGKEAEALAREIAERWNAARPEAPAHD